MYQQRVSSRPRPEEVFAAAVAIIREILDQLDRLFSVEELEAKFQRLARLLKALPLGVDRRHICFLRNWSASSHALWLGDEWEAAGFQLRQIERVLNRLRGPAAR